MAKGLSHSSAFDEIKKLLDLKVIKPKGSGRSAHYVLRQDDHPDD